MIQKQKENESGRRPGTPRVRGNVRHGRVRGGTPFWGEGKMRAVCRGRPCDRNDTRKWKLGGKRGEACCGGKKGVEEKKKVAKARVLIHRRAFRTADESPLDQETLAIIKDGTLRRGKTRLASLVEIIRKKDWRGRHFPSSERFSKLGTGTPKKIQWALSLQGVFRKRSGNRTARKTESAKQDLSPGREQEVTKQNGDPTRKQVLMPMATATDHLDKKHQGTQIKKKKCGFGPH